MKDLFDKIQEAFEIDIISSALSTSFSSGTLWEVYDGALSRENNEDDEDDD